MSLKFAYDQENKFYNKQQLRQQQQQHNNCKTPQRLKCDLVVLAYES